MKLTKFKWFWGWDFDKEEQWLNQMSAKGLQLTGVGPATYIFDEATPGEYLYRIELLENVPSDPESFAYIRFLESTGVEYVGSFLRWVYFRKKAAEGSFDLYSDLDSRINLLRRIRTLMYWLLPMLLTSLFLNLGNFLDHRASSSLAIVGVMMAVLLLYVIGLTNLYRKIEKLKKEKLIHE